MSSVPQENNEKFVDISPQKRRKLDNTVDNNGSTSHQENLVYYDGSDDRYYTLTDTEYTIRYILGLIPFDFGLEIISSSSTFSKISDNRNRNVGVFIHQLYSILNNKTHVDTEISDLRRRGIIRVLNFPNIVGMNTNNTTNNRNNMSTQLLFLSEDYIINLQHFITYMNTSIAVRKSLVKFHHISLKFMSNITILDTELMCTSSSSSSTTTINSSQLLTNKNIEKSNYKKSIEEKDSLTMINNTQGSSSSSQYHHTNTFSHKIDTKYQSENITNIITNVKPLDTTIEPLSSHDIENIISVGFLSTKSTIGNTNSNVLQFSHPILPLLCQQLEIGRSKIMVSFVMN